MRQVVLPMHSLLTSLTILSIALWAKGYVAQGVPLAVPVLETAR